jgi:transcriptional regulator PpsR
LVGDLDAETASRLITAVADVALVLDKRGIVRDVAVEDEELKDQGISDWIGQPWVDTVTVESRPKIEDLLKLKPASAQAWRQVNHPAIEGADLPVKYITVPIAPDGRVVAIGRNLRSFAVLQQRLIEAQREAERELAQIRSTENRYRALYQLSSEAIIILDAQSLRIVEANPAAQTILANGTRRLVGRTFTDIIHAESQADVQTLLGGARAASRSHTGRVKIALAGREVDLSLSLFRQNGASYFLTRMVEPSAKPANDTAATESALSNILERLPEGFVVLDGMRRIVAVNTAFLQLVQLGNDKQVRGEPIDRWLGRVGVDVDILTSSLREHGSVRNFATIVRGEYGQLQDVLISGAAVTTGHGMTFGLTIRRTERPILTSGSGPSITRSVEQLTALIGRTPLKDIVRETTDLIEKLCIEAALKLTKDNRASAAEVLGLSRQGLYIKLRRYGLGELDASE